MLRTALKPHWLALLGVVLAVIVSFTLLGLWQLDVARDTSDQEQRDRLATMPPVALVEVLAPHSVMSAENVGRTVTVSGRYVGAEQVLITPRLLDGRRGSWVLTPLVVEGSGAKLAIIRGFVDDPSRAGTPPAGVVSLTGMLSPPESAPDDPVVLPAGQRQTVDLADLVNIWPGDLYNAMLFPTAQTPPAAATPTHVPPPDPNPGGIAWRNLAYAMQWWFFAAFALYMWWRMVRDDAEVDRAAARLAAAGPPDPDSPAAPAAVVVPDDQAGNLPSEESHR